MKWQRGGRREAISSEEPRVGFFLDEPNRPRRTSRFFLTRLILDRQGFVLRSFPAHLDKEADFLLEWRQ